ncbi:OmpH family outer membrane protein [uncultured Maribacter sp.]|uniref:OmpH family outer membrane protein n=1 Tax=uncultured Maribacter sp. TaxID=431308 RepID=UPI00260F9E92|nr:OmpH family outer membrane protein [uncultured Maribacter sp.]
MKIKILYSLVIFLIIVFLCFLISNFLKTDSVVVVDSQKVIEEYDGFKEAKDAYELRVKEFSKSFKEQRKIYESKSKEFEILESELNEQEKNIKRAKLVKMKEVLLKTGATIEEKSSKEEGKILQAVFNKVNGFIERYGKSKGYKVILGANGQGNILYVEGKSDITEEIIEALNQEYVKGVEE